MIDDIVTGVLVEVITATGQRLGTSVAAAVRGRRRAEDLAVARWFETYRLTQGVPALPEPFGEAAPNLSEILQRDEVQAVLHELLATRLTDAPQEDVARVRAVWDLTFSMIAPDAGHLAATLFRYYDDEICELVSRLQSREPALLRQIRDEAFSARIIATLHAIERHTAALVTPPDPRADTDYLSRYRRHVTEHHGKLDPPDFERRRRVPIAALYVPPSIVQVVEADPRDPPVEISLWNLAKRIDRTVLLGDPGGGKTTAANVLLHYYASTTERQVPFLVTLREFADHDPPQRSVADYIEHKLQTFYQCPAPPALVDRLLLTGRALVIFDGLDELLDPSRRAEVAAVVEQFCTEYPSARVLVTSRLVGYDHARLDDRQFALYRLGGLADDQVGEYVYKWFAQEEGIADDDARRWASAFADESASVPDLRANPLMLSLMCILYRGEGSLPRNRAEVYEQCATLLFRQWDARRRIHLDLRVGHLVEPSLRHLAWWMFTLEQERSAVTERELISETTAFLHGRGFESESDARQAASEFVSFCRGRMWVFSEMGITALGELLYSFTHRTFLEYFAAEHIAYDCDTAERLADTLAPHVAGHEWDIVAELAVQIKDRTSHQGAQRIYTVLLGDRARGSAADRSAVLQFLARCLRSVDPSPGTVRKLTRDVLDHLFAGDLDDPVGFLPLCWLLASCAAHQEIVGDEIDLRVAALVESRDPPTSMNGLRLAIWAPYGITWFGESGPRLARDNPLVRFWRERRNSNIQIYEDAIVNAIHDDAGMRDTALWADLITVDQALAMPGGLLSLFQAQPTGIFGGKWGGDLMSAVRNLIHGRADLYYPASRDPAYATVEKFSALGRYLTDHPGPPWIRGQVDVWTGFFFIRPQGRGVSLGHLASAAYLGAAATVLIAAEATDEKAIPEEGAQWFGPLGDLYPYIVRRWRVDPGIELPELPVQERFGQMFRDWADHKVNLVFQFVCEPDS